MRDCPPSARSSLPPDSRFRGISFSGCPATLPEPRKSGRFDGLHFRGKTPAPAERSPRPPELPTKDGTSVSKLLLLAGIDPSGYRMAPLIRRLPACLRALRVPSVAAAMELLERDPKKREIALHALLIGTTSFFRDTAVFRYLGESAIPEMLARQPRPKVWSTACSNGSELYSVAMLLASHGALGRHQLLGSDCRSQSIAEAERGVYPPEAACSVPPDLAARYLVGGKASVAVAPAIHASVRWECGDLLKKGEAGSWDMIFCRNLAIYLEADTVRSLWRHLADALVPGGMLVVGKAEKPRLEDLSQIGPCTYRKTSPK